MENPENYCQTWNSRSQKYVLIKKGKGGGMTGDMSPEPFPGVPIKKAKPERQQSGETGPRESKQSDTSSKTKQNEQPEPEQQEQQEQDSWGSFFGF